MPKSRIAAKVREELNRQINLELAAAHSYLALSLWCEVRNFKGFAKYFVKQAGEERAHADRILKHLTDRGETAALAAVPAPQQEFKSLLEVAQQAQAGSLTDLDRHLERQLEEGVREVGPAK